MNGDKNVELEFEEKYIILILNIVVIFLADRIMLFKMLIFIYKFLLYLWMVAKK